MPPTGKDEETAVRDDAKVLRARMAHWDPASGGVTQWGESNLTNSNDCIDFLVKWKIVPAKVPGEELITSELGSEINASFRQSDIKAQARA